MAKYDEWLTERGLQRLGQMAREGLTDVEIAKQIGISRSTLSEWKTKFKDFRETLKEGKAVVDAKVENSLLKKALGYKEKLLKPIKVKSVKFENGRKVAEDESVVQAEEEVFYPPDTTAIIFWLKNRVPERWKDKIISEIAEENASLEDFIKEQLEGGGSESGI